MISASDNPTGVVPKVRVRIKALAHLPERPPFDEGEFGLRDVAAAEFPQQVERRDTLSDLVTSGLDRRLDAQQLAEQQQQPGVEFGPGRGDLARDGAQAAAGRDRELDRFALHADRRQRDPRESGSQNCEHERAEKEQRAEEFAHQSSAAGELRGRDGRMGCERLYNSRNPRPASVCRRRSEATVRPRCGFARQPSRRRRLSIPFLMEARQR
jgi:hypothetical protein